MRIDLPFGFNLEQPIPTEIISGGFGSQGARIFEDRPDLDHQRAAGDQRNAVDDRGADTHTVTFALDEHCSSPWVSSRGLPEFRDRCGRRGPRLEGGADAGMRGRKNPWRGVILLGRSTFHRFGGRRRSPRRRFGFSSSADRFQAHRVSALHGIGRPIPIGRPMSSVTT
ncbi:MULTISPECIES: hypothetical protein [unclassified Rhodococcus (in: high G+C Gram-positive bacteria)]|uniref:hypothetical protein n=1 Tax=unclassified Rhodococcus (in: high G+C Gram-positive bacteria) TaxID=192944 RepID=UPI00163A5700|nr:MULTISPECIES: hypothetical protein [unclassified Rhodococcus (in: high G+C Gram-positive bacteria)]MBC2638253.1 hypothetical protein [Rhodococcus sp. 3A]MBC2897006.1 hypothetical protein [Rhodococcus sp. 4CII]